MTIQERKKRLPADLVRKAGMVVNIAIFGSDPVPQGFVGETSFLEYAARIL